MIDTAPYQILFLGSLQKHCVKVPLRERERERVGSSLGTTDLGLPKILVEYD